MSAALATVTPDGHDPDDTQATNVAHYISAPELRRLLRGEGRVNLVDLRDTLAYQRFHVEGAVRLDPLQLRTLTAWQREPIVLVGTGAAYRALEALQLTLRSEGFEDVQILDGGTRRWESIIGVSADRTSMRIKPAQLDLPGDASRWLLLNASDTGLPHISGLTVLDASDGDPRTQLRAVQSVNERRKTDAASAEYVANLLVIADSSERAAQIAGELEGRLPINVFALEGSVEDLRELTQLRERIAQPRGDEAYLRAGGQCW
jgi:rhodanese-related sulfurtransferase